MRIFGRLLSPYHLKEAMVNARRSGLGPNKLRYLTSILSAYLGL